MILRACQYNAKKASRSLPTYHLISRCTAMPHNTSRTRTTGMAAMVIPNSAELLFKTTMRSCIVVSSNCIHDLAFLTCIVTPMKKKKSNFRRQIMIWYQRYISAKIVRHALRRRRTRLTLHLGVRADDVEDGPASRRLGKDAFLTWPTHPNSA